jgi:hypothetical protein
MDNMGRRLARMSQKTSFIKGEKGKRKEEKLIAVSNWAFP